MKMSKVGFPSRFTQLLFSRFIKRTAKVRVIGFIGHTRTFKEGLPHGTILSPLLLTIYIDDLLAECEEDSFVSVYVDDLLIARSAHNKDMIVASLQPEVDKVIDWSTKAILTLNSSK